MVVTIIIPVFNAEKFLRTSVESALNQSYEALEILLVNDGSTDKSLKICQTYAQKDSRIKILDQQNKGPAAARNTGLKHATGQFVYFLDADDYLTKETIQVLVEHCKATGADMVLSNFAKLENGKQINQQVAFSPADRPFTDAFKILSGSDMVDYTRQFLQNPSNHLISYCWARLYKLSILKEHNVSGNEEMHLFEDLVLNLEYLTHARTLAFINRPLYIYAMHNNHMSASMAILNADSLLHDMALFKEKVNRFLVAKSGGTLPRKTIQKEIGSALVHYAIIFMVRSCRWVNRKNQKEIYCQIKKLVTAPLFKQSLASYTPTGKNSRILPLFIKFNLIYLLMVICRFKAIKRYGPIKDNR